MKKLFAIAIALSLAGSAMAAGSVGFEWGTNFYKPSASGGKAGNGTNFLLSWNLDSDLSLGVYTESSNLLVNDTTGAVCNSTLNTSAIQVMKGIVKNVQIGLNIGSGTVVAAAPLAAETKPLVDVVGIVTILSGTGEKVTGNLRALAAARFLNTSTGTNPKLDGVNLGLAVQALF
jgi:hypothetical protein